LDYENYKQEKKKGFTLIELIVVIAILAILAAIAVPNFIGITDTARAAQQNGAAAEFANAVNIYNATAKTRIVSKPANLSALITTLSTLAPTMSTDISSTTVFNKLVISAAGVATVDKTKT